MERFLLRHTIAMPAGEEPIKRHYALDASSRAEALRVGNGIDANGNPFANAKVEVIGHIVNGWPVYDL